MSVVDNIVPSTAENLHVFKGPDVCNHSRYSTVVCAWIQLMALLFVFTTGVSRWCFAGFRSQPLRPPCLRQTSSLSPRVFMTSSLWTKLQWTTKSMFSLKFRHTIVGRAIRPLDVDRQHQSTSYAYCYEFGLPSDCSPGTPAGQCSLTSYAFCCGVGTPVTYSETPVNTLIRMCWSRQSCLQCHC